MIRWLLKLYHQNNVTGAIKIEDNVYNGFKVEILKGVWKEEDDWI